MNDDYEAWLNTNYEELEIEAAETGADRELDFDFDDFCEKRYFSDETQSEVSNEPKRHK